MKISFNTNTAENTSNFLVAPTQCQQSGLGTKFISLNFSQVQLQPAGAEQSCEPFIQGNAMCLMKLVVLHADH